MKNNILIAHSGGPSPVINASLAGIIHAAHQNPTIDRIYVATYGIEGLLHKAIIDITDITPDDIELLKNTPSSAIGTCRYKISEPEYATIIAILKEYRIGTLFYTGGNDSMDTCLKLSRIAADIQIIGVPKTIDNDLFGTDHTPGYGSAARFAALATKELGLDIRALPIHVSVLELMGRNAGWITAASYFARDRAGDAPHLVYLPERPLSENQILDEVQAAYRQHGGIVVVVCEGLKDEHGRSFVQPKHESDFDSFGHPIPGGVSDYVSRLITRRLGIRSRSEKPGLIGRGSLSVFSDVDREESFQLGSYALQSTVDGASGIMVGYHRTQAVIKSSSAFSCATYGIDFCNIPLNEVANVERLFPKEWILSSSEVHQDFFDYARPLLGAPFPRVFSFDLPSYSGLKLKVSKES
jgi:ATP-dependent phosphofructokinase / diphosphate-dependent phosphofructokinase